MKKIPFDQFQRYKKTVELIDSFRKENECFSILEVGANEHKNLEQFLENDQITYLDIIIPDHLRNDPAYKEGDATNMHFSDGQYDLVIALDVFEHIPPELRERFIDELARVSKYSFIIAAPFNTEGVSETEERANQFFKTLYGMDYIWLKEHVDNGLPEWGETLEYFQANKLDCIHFSHGSLDIWEKMINLHFYGAGHSNLYDYRALIDSFYEQNIFNYDNARPCYRQFIVGIKDETRKAPIQLYLDSVSSTLVSKENIMKINELENNLYHLGTLEKLKEAMQEKLYAKEMYHGEKEKYLNEIAALNQLLVDKVQETNALQAYIYNLEAIAQSLRLKNRVIRSVKWVIPTTMRPKVKKGFKVLRLLQQNPAYLKRAYLEWKHEGLKGLTKKLKAKVSSNGMGGNQNYKPESVFNKAAIQIEIEQFNVKPLISVIMPVYNVDLRWLKLAIESVTNQLYPNWELCIADDCSPNKEIKRYLQTIVDDRIKITFLDKNQGISGASNEAVKLATGPYLALLDNDDELTLNALFEVAKAINETGADLLYSDEDKIDKHGNRKNPMFKPDWSPDLLRSQMYIGHLFVFTKDLFIKAGQFRLGFEGSQDYDLAFRMSEIAEKISHIPKVLYCWRELESSTSLNPYSKPGANLIGLNALNEHLQRVFGAEKAWANEDENIFVYDTRYRLAEEPPMVSIIIPTKDKIDLLEPCVTSIIEKTNYPNYEILIMNNNSKSQETQIWFKRIQEKYAFVRVIDALYEFNWSKLNNHGIKEAQGDVYVFLNNDTEVFSENWLQRLSEKAIRDDVGTVGGLLLYEDGTIQHAGVVVGMGGWADHVFKGMHPAHYGSPYISPMLTRNVSASTGACLAVSKYTIEQIGDFDEQFIICGSDVELSLRAIKKGRVNIYDPHVRLLHLESKTRTSFIPENDFVLSKAHYASYQEFGDPYFNMNLSLTSPMPALR
jgi:glycosyltransferase involved in cell wall biosynthesis